jgi:hypothetical protein
MEVVLSMQRQKRGELDAAFIDAHIHPENQKVQD